jgi:hypothetical protein
MHGPLVLKTSLTSVSVLSENLISGEIPTQVSSLANLELFSIFRVLKPGSKLSGPLPSFHQKPKLIDLYLYLEGNDLTGTIPHDFLSASTNARLVTLSFNDLNGIPPESLVSHEVLNLQLEGNNLVAFPPIFCNSSKWMNGAVGTVGCTAFLCPSGSSSPIGRANATVSCDRCANTGGALYFGSTSCAAPPRQRQILVRIYQQCGGTDWYRSDDWVSGEPHCNWYGIECENEDIISINLGSNNLVGTPPREIFHLPELKTLELFSNPITFEFDNISAAKKLTTLRLDSTGLSSLGGIAETPSLTFLDVKFNALEGQFDSALLELENLRYLNMGNNKMTGELPLDAFSGLRYLKTLRLGSNEFTGPVPAFDLLMGLATIDLSDNLLTGFRQNLTVLKT